MHDDAVMEQIAALPIAALIRYAELWGVLELAPGNGRPYSAALPDGTMRELVFGGDGEGTVTYLILEHQREVHVLLVQWLG